MQKLKQKQKKTSSFINGYKTQVIQNMNSTFDVNESVIHE